MHVNVIGAGLAGCEAAWYLANKGIKVKLYEQKKIEKSPAHINEDFCELVCSNSLRSNDPEVACGLLKQEMEKFNSIVISAAKETEVPAGSSLSVDREKFSEIITKKLKAHENIEVIDEVVEEIKDEYTIVATGPLTNNKFKEYLSKYLGEEYLYFYDAIAPIVDYDSIDMNKCYLKSRYDKGDAAYLNCPMTEEEFNVFYEELINAECVELKEFELKVFEGCLPFEVMAKRGKKTLLFGPMKPVGLEHNGNKPYAVVQLRQDNIAKSLYNLVGFQTHLKFPEQKRILQLIPGLENVEIIRYGVMHMNTFINSPKLLKQTYQTIKNEKVFFAGQITGVEGYVESAASGINAAINMYKLINNKPLINFPKETAMGAMSFYITHSNSKYFQPMNINYGIFEPIDIKVKKKERKAYYSKRANDIMDQFIKDNFE